MGVTGFVFDICATKDKYRVLLQGFPVATVTDYVTASCSAIIGVSYGTITLLILDTAL